jgi:hypothetical protein
MKGFTDGVLALLARAIERGVDGRQRVLCANEHGSTAPAGSAAGLNVERRKEKLRDA